MATGTTGRHERVFFLLNDASALWKSLRITIRDLLFYSLLLESNEYKKVLGACFVSSYKDLVRSHLMTDSEPELSNLFISLQLLTTPSISRYLVEEHDLLGVIINALNDTAPICLTVR